MSREYLDKVVAPPSAISTEMTFAVIDFEDALVLSEAGTGADYLFRADLESGIAGRLGFHLKTKETVPAIADYVQVGARRSLVPSKILQGLFPFRLWSLPANSKITGTLELTAYVGSSALYADFIINCATRKVYVTEKGGAEVEVGTLDGVPQYYPILAVLEADKITKKYSRLTINGQNFDVSGIELFDFGVSYAGNLISMIITSLNANRTELYLDNLILRAISI